MATIKLEKDKPREIRFTMATIRRFKEVYGKPLNLVRTRAPHESMPEVLDPACMCMVLWCGLIDGDDRITSSRVEALLERHFKHGGKLDAVLDPLGEAFKENPIFGTKDNVEDEDEEEEEDTGKVPEPGATS